MQVVNYIVFFDGICNLCNSSVQRLIRIDKKRILLFAPLQSEAAKKYLTDELLPDSIVFYKQGHVFTHSNAVLEIMKLMGFPYNLSLILYIFPKFIRDSVYKFIAKNRYTWYGQRRTCMVPTSELKERFLI
jgi:predicted DCC family thiol-disulfide oxidoreductase YuxK